MEKEGTDKIGIFEDTVSFYDKRESNTKTQIEKETLNPLFNEILQKLKIDKDKNGRLEAGELAGLSLTQEKQKELSYIVAKHESEWEDATRFEALATFMDEMKATEYAEMMRDRTKKLSFFDDVMAMKTSPTFFHPIALVGAMVNEDCNSLIWGAKVSAEFRAKVIQICKELWGEKRKMEMANGLMAVMKVETGGTFAAHQIMGKRLQSLGSMTKDDFFINKTNKSGGSRAIGLIQFTQSALVGLGLFKNGLGFDKLHELKLNFAQMGEVKQLDYVKQYFEKNKNKIKKPEDIYSQVFAPRNVGKDLSTVLYTKGTEEYKQNSGIDVDKDGNLTLSELMTDRYYPSYKEGEKYRNECEEEIEKVEEVLGDWHDPVDNPMSTNYMQSGGGGLAGKHWGLFGTTRNGSNHTGLDLFAKAGTNIYACMDGTVYKRGWHGGYGNTITIKVNNHSFFKKNNIDYKLKYKQYGEIREGVSFSRNNNIYLFYAHLEEVNEFKIGDKVKLGDILGKTGRSGISKGTTAPHLHFEIFSTYKMQVGTRYKINPAYYVRYKVWDAQSVEERKTQEDEKELGKQKAYEGKKKLQQIW